MTSDHDAYWEAVGSGELTSDALRHERECRACADMRWALEELHWDYETPAPPVPADLVEDICRHLGEAPAVLAAAPPSEKRPRLPLYVTPVARGRLKVPVLAGLVTSLVVAGLAAVALGVRPAAVPAYADVALPDRCTAALKKHIPDRVVVAGVWAGEERRRFRLVLDRFEAETRIKVVFASRDPEADRDLGHTLRTLDDDGCAPGVALLPQPGLVRDLSREGRLRPVENYVGNLVDDNYMPLWRQLGTGDDGQLYGVWFKAANKSMIWYNARTFAQAGLEPPEDWEGLKDVNQKLRAKGITPFSVAASKSAGWTLSDWFENIYLQTAGPELYDQLTHHEIPWDHATVVTALELMADILRPQWIVPGAAETTYEESVRRVFEHLDRPVAAMVFEADFVANEVAKTDATIGEDAKFFPFPSITGGMPTVVGGAEQVASGEVGGDVAVLMQDTREARALLRFLARPDAAVPWAQLGGFLSPNRNFPALAYPDDATRAAARGLAQATTVRFDLSDLQHAEFGSTPGKGMWGILRDFVKDQPAPKATADRLEDAYCSTAPPAKESTCRR